MDFRGWVPPEAKIAVVVILLLAVGGVIGWLM